MPEKAARFRFYAELGDFFPPERRQQDLDYRFCGSPAVKDAIEALGVPHTEIDLILVGGRSVGFEHRLADGDQVAVYPVFESLDISPVLRLRPAPLRDSRFVLDAHLGRLARLLRLLGLDVLYRNDYQDAEIVRVACEEHRIILTRDRGLLKRKAVTHGYWIRSTDPRAQARELLERFDLRSQLAPFSRCLVCNAEIRPVDKREIEHRLLPRTRRDHDEFRLCPGCGKIYWRGSHHERMAELVRSLTR